MFRKETDRVLYAQYHGSHQTTQSCLDALARLLVSSTAIHRALLLTNSGRHGFYLDVDDPEPIFIRCGFTSGYPGEGSAGLAIALHLLRRFKVETEEIEVSSSLLDLLDRALLDTKDMNGIEAGRIIRPIRLHDYMNDGLHLRENSEDAIRKQLYAPIPWSTLDERLVDLALLMLDDPDRAVFEAFRRLESEVRNRCGFAPDAHGTQLFKRAFRGEGAVLSWPGCPKSEVEGRAQLFEAAFMAYRNPRAHHETVERPERAYSEFHVVNELFVLERLAQRVRD